MEGWISLHRKLKNHWIWSNELYLKIWIDFLLRASYERKTVVTSAGLVTIEVGSFLISQLTLAKEYGVSRSKIRTFLKLLKFDQMIDLQVNTKFTKITICNYESYQHWSPTEDQQKTRERTTEGQQKDTTNKENKEIKKINLVSFVSDDNTKTNINNQLIDSSKSKTVSDTKVNINKESKAHKLALRKQSFKEEIKQYADKYDKEVLNDFYSYWTEPNRSKTKMRFEMEKTWDIARRIDYWARNSDRFGGNGKKSTWSENDVIEYCTRNKIPFTASGGTITGLSAHLTKVFKLVDKDKRVWEKIGS